MVLIELTMLIKFIQYPYLSTTQPLNPLSALSYQLIGPVAFRFPIARDLALSYKKTKKAPLRHSDVLPGALF